MLTVFFLWWCLQNANSKKQVTWGRKKKTFLRWDCRLSITNPCYLNVKSRQSPRWRSCTKNNILQVWRLILRMLKFWAVLSPETGKLRLEDFLSSLTSFTQQPLRILSGWRWGRPQEMKLMLIGVSSESRKTAMASNLLSRNETRWTKTPQAAPCQPSRPAGHLKLLWRRRSSSGSPERWSWCEGTRGFRSCVCFSFLCSILACVPGY